MALNILFTGAIIVILWFIVSRALFSKLKVFNRKIAPMNKKKYYLLVGLIIFSLIAFFAYMDMQGMNMFSTVGGFEGETYSKIKDSYMTFFWSFAYAIIFVVATIYYYFRRDLSEALGIVLGTVLMLWGGLEDIIYYVFIGQPLNTNLPWLWETPLSLGSRILGYDTVTPLGLWFNLGIYTVITIIIIKYLRKTNKTICGVRI